MFTETIIAAFLLGTIAGGAYVWAVMFRPVNRQLQDIHTANRASFAFPVGQALRWRRGVAGPARRVGARRGVARRGKARQGMGTNHTED